jgi:hypothetical protein
MAEDKDVITSSGDNPRLDPAAVLSLERKAGTRGDSKLESSFERNSLGQLTHWTQLEASNKALEGRKSYWGDHPMANLQGPATTGMAKQTERMPPQRDLSGGGAKSGIKSSKNLSSASGRIGVSGANSRLAKEAIGNMRNFIPMMGVPASGVTAGPFRFRGLSFNGAFPVLNLRQYDAGLAATYSNMEEEDE